MFHPRSRSLAELEAAAYHPQFCRCPDCAVAHDPIGYRRARRVVRLQAFALLAFAAAIYGTLFACAPAVAASFGVAL